MKCPKCDSETTCELLPASNSDKWRVKYECVNEKCHLRSWMFVQEAAKAEVATQVEMKFSRNKDLKCEICEHFTDILHRHVIEGDGEYLMCGSCKEAFAEAEGTSRFKSSFL